jgi:anti-sigma factor RsiW
MLTCKDVATAIGQDELRTGSWPKRVALRFHLVMCRHCRRYAAQLRAIGAAARAAFRARGEDPVTLDRIQQRALSRAETKAGSRRHTR